MELRQATKPYHTDHSIVYRGCINKKCYFGENVNLRNINRIEAR
jgi:hypothetical protein